jgi:hypothetical protein
MEVQHYSPPLGSGGYEDSVASRSNIPARLRKPPSPDGGWTGWRSSITLHRLAAVETARAIGEWDWPSLAWIFSYPGSLPTEQVVILIDYCMRFTHPNLRRPIQSGDL